MLEQEEQKRRSVQPWQTLVGEIFQNKAIRLALAQELEFNPASMLRWGNGIVPRQEEITLRKLANAQNLPTHFRNPLVDAIKKTYPDFEATSVSALMTDTPAKDIPSPFYAEIVDAYAYVVEDLLFGTVGNIITHQLFGHLDRDESAGVSAMVLLCTPPARTTPGGIVRSFYVPFRQIGDRNAPLPTRFPLFVGTESLLTDLTHRYHRPFVLDADELLSLSTPFPPEVQSLAICPIQRRGLFAGSLLVSSHVRDYFSKERCQVIKRYSALVALSFQDRDFYPRRLLQLDNFPTLRSQQDLEAVYPFRLRVEQIRERLNTASLNDHHGEQEVLELSKLTKQLNEKLVTFSQRQAPLEEQERFELGRLARQFCERLDPSPSHFWDQEQLELQALQELERHLITLRRQDSSSRST